MILRSPPASSSVRISVKTLAKRYGTLEVFRGIDLAVGEFFTAIGGLGYFILYMSRTFRHDEAFVGVLLLAGFGVGFDLLTTWCTRRFLPWYRREERTT